MAAENARLLGAFGAQGSGKTAWALQAIERMPLRHRLVCWDFKHDPRLKGIGADVRSVPELARAMKAPKFRLRLLVNHDLDIAEQFKWFCTAAWGAGNVLMVVDELPEVTRPGKAPPLWRKCINIGRQYAHPETGKPCTLAIVGMAQRPAEVDKSFIGNLDVLHVGRLGEVNDAREMAGKLGCDWRELTTLENLHWIEKRAGQIEPARGVLSFRKGK